MGNKTLKVTITRKIKFPRFPSFWFWPIPEIENLEVSENFGLIQFLVAWETQNPKTRKLTSNKENVTLRWDLIKKRKLQWFPSFQFGSINKMENSEI